MRPSRASFAFSATVLAHLSLLAPGAQAGRGSLPYGFSDYNESDSTTTLPSWAAGPGLHHRLYLDVYNVTDFYDFETSSAEGFPDGTFFADTLRPTLTLMWDERFRIQLGAIALRGYGDSKGFGMVDPWIQLLWQPARPVSLIFGNLNTPHYYFPALFYPLNYIRESTHEQGMQVLYQRPHWYDDLYFNYRRQDTTDHREKFDLGFVHRNAWRWLRLTYQSHWIHEGGELNSHEPLTINDVAQAGGGGLHMDVTREWAVGAKYLYLTSHYRADATPIALRSTHNGSGSLFEIYGRWRQFKLIAQDWTGHGYQHEGGDRLFQVDRMHVFTLRGDLVLSRDFSILAEGTGYFVGTNSEGIDKVMKAAIHVQAAWQFSIPLFEWSSPSVTPEGQPIPERWDDGL